jgi:hypothetical protein
MRRDPEENEAREIAILRAAAKSCSAQARRINQEGKNRADSRGLKRSEDVEK